MNTLEFPVTDVLTMFPEWLRILIIYSGRLFFISIIIYILYRIWPYIKQYYASKNRIQSTMPVAVTFPPTFSNIIEQIRDETLKTKLYRDGCFLISKELRMIVEKHTGLQIEEMSAEEIHKALSDKQISKFFINLRNLQFRRSEPDEKEFKSAIREALTIVSKQSGS